MLFNSYDYLIFLPVVFLLYWFVFQRNLKAQNAFILLASYVFYGWWDWRFLGLIALSSLVDYICGLRMGGVIARRNDEAISNKGGALLQAGNVSENFKTTDSLRNDDESWLQNPKFYLFISIAVNLGLLGFFKYFNFFIESATDLINTMGFQANTYSLGLILPVGISFYTFQTMSYTIDIYRRKMEPTKDPVAFFAYVSFFPQLVAGPIERAANLLPQFFKKREFTYEKGSEGLKLILWGLFKKLVIADNCALVVNPIFANYSDSSGLELVLGAVLFAFQIYGDFSGYSDIAIGTGKLLGFDLMTNFRTPYFSRDIAEFWRRWHISLSTWFRDYIYIPLGGSKVNKWLSIRNIFVIFLASGFWHGANWTFIVWGGLNAIFFIPLFLQKKNRRYIENIANKKFLPSFREFGQIILTFSFVCIAWVFFRSASITDAWLYFSSILNQSFFPANYNFMNYDLRAALALFVFLEWVGRKNLNFLEMLPKVWWRYSVYAVLSYLIVYWGVFGEPIEFIYFQF